MSTNKRSKRIVVNLQHCMYPIVTKCVKEMGWRVAGKNDYWDVGISDNNQMVRALQRMQSHPRTLNPVQRINHFPNMKQLYRKDCLAKNFNALCETPGGIEVFDMLPQTWTIPGKLGELTAHLEQEKKRRATADDGGPAVMAPVYIIKPASGLQGIGISLSTAPDKSKPAASGKEYVVQRYIDPPLLIDGFKFDLRLYVLVTSVKPMKIFLFNDGLVRLCTTKYTPPSKDNLKTRQAHLTNYSLNVKSKNFVKGSDGSKRSLKSTMASMKAEGKDVDSAWNSIVGVVVKTLIGVQPKLQQAYDKTVAGDSILKMPGNSACYEILGFDVMLDSDMKAWLIEVNHAPSFRGGSKVDNRIKRGVISEALSLLKVTQQRKRVLVKRVHSQWEKFMRDQGARPKSAIRPSSDSGIATSSSLSPMARSRMPSAGAGGRGGSPRVRSADGGGSPIRKAVGFGSSTARDIADGPRPGAANPRQRRSSEPEIKTARSLQLASASSSTMCHATPPSPSPLGVTGSKSRVLDPGTFALSVVGGGLNGISLVGTEAQSIAAPVEQSYRYPSTSSQDHGASGSDTPGTCESDSESETYVGEDGGLDLDTDPFLDEDDDLDATLRAPSNGEDEQSIADDDGDGELSDDIPDEDGGESSSDDDEAVDDEHEEADDDGAQDEPRSERVFKAPMPSDPDHFERIYFDLSARDRAQYSKAARLAALAFPKREEVGGDA